MQSARDRITLGLAIVVAVVSAMAASWYVAAPLLLVALFLIGWGRSPERTETLVGGVPLIGTTLLNALAYLDGILSPQQQEAGNAERRQHAKEKWATLSDSAKSVLASTFVHGVPKKSHPSDWKALRQAGFVEGEPSSGSIKPEYKDVIADHLRGDGLIV